MIAVLSLPAFGAEDLPYFKYRPSEPRVRWTDDKIWENNLAWQVSYRLEGSVFFLGGLEINPGSSDWRIVPGQTCYRSTKFAFQHAVDGDEIEICRLENEDKTTPPVSLNGNAIDLSGEITLAENSKHVLQVRLGQSLSLRISMKVPRIEIVDLILQDGARSVGYRFPPELRLLDFHFWDYSFPYPELFERRKLEDQAMYFSWKSSSGIELLRPFPTKNKWPIESERPRLKRPRTLGSYSDRLLFDLTTDKGKSLAKVENLESGKWNLRTVTVDDRTWTVDVLRMYPNEASVRGSLANGPSGNVAMLADLTVSRYFEKLPFSQNYDSWASHRFGSRVRAFSSVGSIGNSGFERPVALTSFSAEARMDLGKGLWNFDTKWGLLAGLTHFSVEESSQDYLGMGFYWARPLPVVFDKILNTVPYFRYPKYVDLDFTYLAFDERFGPVDPSWVLNLHGKMIFSKRWFFELGYGWTQLSLETKLTRRKLNFFSTTSGFGYLF
jgi:hypothetical protein